MITKESSLVEVAAIVSQALYDAGIAGTLSGGAAVSIYTDNAYQSSDLDFVTAALLETVKPVMESLGFRHAGTPGLSQFEHPEVDWFVEFPPAPLTFGNLQVDDAECAVIETKQGALRIITPTQSVLDRLAATLHWNDQQSRTQAIMVAARNQVDWKIIRQWFLEEVESLADFERFKRQVTAVK